MKVGRPSVPRRVTTFERRGIEVAPVLVYYTLAWLLILLASVAERSSPPTCPASTFTTIAAVAGFAVTLWTGIDALIERRSVGPVSVATVLILIGGAIVWRVWPPSSWDGPLIGVVVYSLFKIGGWIVRLSRSRRPDSESG